MIFVMKVMTYLETVILSILVSNLCNEFNDLNIKLCFFIEVN